ncbi:MAG: hypothetical protein IK100_07685 [Muribaculaceae bacterium]|nr:hypothetical protein [Muribaculaceae bacterium]
MKKYGFFAAFVVACGMTMLVACQPQSETSSNPASEGENSTELSAADAASANQPLTIEQAVDQYLVDTFGKQYSQADVCIPQQIVTATDDADEQDIKVWGDFWVFNYNIAGDTLKTASGGSHPGLMHLKKAEKGYEVTAFDQVGDGSQFEPTAKKIFGDKYDAFMKMHSNDKEREQNRAQGIAKYAKAHNLKVTMYQDYGWPAVKLPE